MAGRNGITNRQAHILADLQRQLGLKYTGSGMSRSEAGRTITKLLAQRDRRRAAHR